MIIRVLQLNMFRGKFIENIIDYIKKNDFDLIHLQEVTSGKISFDGVSCFEVLTKFLQDTYKVESITTWQAEEDPNTSFSNATFYKNKFQLLKREVRWLRSFRKIPNFEKRNIEDDPHCILGLCLSNDNATFWSLNTHLAWSPSSKDTPEKIRQGEVLFRFVRSLKKPFVLSGDFNVDTKSQIISWLESCGKNLVKEHNISNTLNPRIHYARELFPSGIAVDFIFVSKDIRTEHFQVVENPDLSDHLGLSANISI